MRRSHKIERKLFLCTSTFTIRNDRYRRRPIHIVAVSITNPATWGTIKGKMAVQRRDVGPGKSRSQRENIQISTRGEMGMHNIEILLSHLFQCLLQVIKGFEMHCPGDALLKQRFWEK